MSGRVSYAAGIDLDDEDSLGIPASSPNSAEPPGQRYAILRFQESQHHGLSPAEMRRLDYRAGGPHFDFISCRALRIPWPISNGSAPGLAGGSGPASPRRHRDRRLWGLSDARRKHWRSVRHGIDVFQVAGLGLLPVQTVLMPEKTTQVIQASTPAGHSFSAYEIHLGETTMPSSLRRLSPCWKMDRATAPCGQGHWHLSSWCAEDPEVLAELGMSPPRPP